MLQLDEFGDLRAFDRQGQPTTDAAEAVASVFLKGVSPDGV